MIHRLKYLKYYFKIKKSKLFDEKFYLLTYEDVRKSDIDPLWHYILYGWKEKRLPFKGFSYELFNPNKNPLLTLIDGKLYFCDEEYILPDFSVKPLVSIIILNRNGAHYIKQLFPALIKNTFYPNIEIIFVDNASTDNSVDIINTFNKKLNIKVIKNNINKSFSIANNEAVKIANGELLLFLNNDTLPFKGWLCELVKEYLNNSNIGSVGSKLIYPYKKDFAKSFKIQHAGIKFRYEGDFYRPFNIGDGENIEEFSTKSNRVALTAACLLVPKDKFLEVGGFDEQYVYGYEDVDLGLKLFKKGYNNVYVSSSKLFHFEFGTQSTDSKDVIKKRRQNNIEIFRKKWHIFIKKNYWKEKLFSKQNLFTDPLHIAFIVSNKGNNVAEGDYFTALEFGNSLKKLGYKISFLSLKHNEWYNFSDDIDVLIVLLDKYDLKKIPKRNKKLIKIAWVRNWFERWVKNKSFKDYDLIFSSSYKGKEFLSKYTSNEVFVFPIATNPERFKNNELDEKYKCDYCFTGSYWNDERDIIKYLNPDNIKYKFHIYGKNWEKISKFRTFYKGFISYEKMNRLYSNTKIVLDDANRVTKPFGSVNSRVFDALGKGKLVITNGEIGSIELFNGALPVYHNEEELEKLINFYLENDKEREELVNYLQNIVLNNHTYDVRAKEFREILSTIFLKKSIVFKIPVPSKEVKEEWGDFHFAKSLDKYFKRLDYHTKIQFLNEWNINDENFDVVLVLRGLNKYIPKSFHINLMWNISHPDKISLDEYKLYHKVYIASISYTEELKKYLSNVETLLQCSDKEIFYPIENIEKDIDILFIGNSRKVFRQIIKDLLSKPIKYKFWLIGNHWEKFVSKELIKYKNIENEKLYLFYNRAKIVLNDHWQDMKNKGFISNRIFDVSLCGGFLISDYVKDLEKVFGDCIVTYKDSEDLHNKIDFFIKNEKKRKEKSNKAREIVLSKHTFDKRVEVIDSYIQTFLKEIK